MSTQLEPDDADVLQEEDASAVTVPVCITDQRSPVRTQALPRKAGATMTKGLTTTAQQVLWADHRRASATLVCSAAIRVAYNLASSQDATRMAVWPANVPLVVDATTDVFAATVSSTADLGILTSLWAEG